MDCTFFIFRVHARTVTFARLFRRARAWLWRKRDHAIAFLECGQLSWRVTLRWFATSKLATLIPTYSANRRCLAQRPVAFAGQTLAQVSLTRYRRHTHTHLHTQTHSRGQLSLTHTLTARKVVAVAAPAQLHVAGKATWHTHDGVPRADTASSHASHHHPDAKGKASGAKRTPPLAERKSLEHRPSSDRPAIGHTVAISFPKLVHQPGGGVSETRGRGRGANPQPPPPPGERKIPRSKGKGEATQEDCLSASY